MSSRGDSNRATYIGSFSHAGLPRQRYPELGSLPLPFSKNRGSRPVQEAGCSRLSGEFEGNSVANSAATTVSPAIQPMPHNGPDWVALRVLRLE